MGAGYSSFRATKLLLIFAKILQCAVDNPANLLLKLVSVFPVLRKRRPAEMDALPDHLVDLARSEYLGHLPGGVFATITGDAS
jgi:hypothetical protein